MLGRIELKLDEADLGGKADEIDSGAMAKDNITIAELLGELQKQPRVSYRAMLRREKGPWTLQALIADTNPSSQSDFVYNYGYVAFIGRTAHGRRFSTWLKNRKGTLARLKFVIPQLQENIFSDRWPSCTKKELFLSVPEPYSLHRIYISGRANYQHDFLPLVKSGCPSFPTLGEAANRLLYGYYNEGANREPDDILVRIIHREAWLESLRLQKTGITLSVSGSRVSGTRLEINAGDDLRLDIRLRKAGTRRISLPSGLPNRVWLILSRGDRWLDYRNIDLRGGTAPRIDGVLVDPPDVCSQIKGLIERGEGDTREFKREISRERDNTFLKTVAAFANGTGGVILFGVVDSTGEIKGITGDLQQQKDRITNMIRDNVVPEPNVRIENCKLSGKQIIAAFIEEGNTPPYGLDAARPRFYVRRGATTFPANQAEVRALAKKNEPDYGPRVIYPFGSHI